MEIILGTVFALVVILIAFALVFQKQVTRFQRPWEKGRIINRFHKGLLIDGAGRNRLSQKNSFEHVALISPTGGGKTTRYIVPNLLSLDDCSMVVTDPSGEIFQQTAGYLEKKGFRIEVLNLEEPGMSRGYNPVAKASTFTEIDKLAAVLMRSANPVVSPGDAIWYEEPQTLMAVLLRCLKETPDFANLHNLLHLLQNFGDDGKALEDFLVQYAPDEATLNQFKGFVSGNERMRAAFLTMAQNALRLLNNPEIASMMSRDEIDFHALREEKTVLYLIVPETDARFYSFVVNCFFMQFFEAQKQLRYKNEGLPIYVLFDEFGQYFVPDFDTISTTIRKFRVSLSIIIQDPIQLVERYGQNMADTILSGGIRTKLFYSGLDLKTSETVEKMLGRVKVGMREENLMNADRIRRLDEKKGILVTSNQEPILFRAKPFYKDGRMKRKTRIKKRRGPKKRSSSELKYYPLSEGSYFLEPQSAF